MAGSAPEVRAGLEFPPPYRPQASSSSTASSAEHADAQRKAQSAAAIYKLKQSAHRSDSSSSVASSPSPSRAGGPSSSSAPTISEPFSKIVAGAASVSRTLSSELTMAEKLTSDRRGRSASPPASPPSPTSAPVTSAKSDESSRRPTLHVDTSSGRRPPTGSRSGAEDASVVVGPLEALKLATGSTIQEPAWAQPFPSPSVALQHSELEDTHAGFSPFTLGFDGGIHRSASHERDHAWGVASAFTTSSSSNHENDPLGTHSGVASASVFATPPPLPMAPASASASSSSLSFASIDAIFSQRSESSTVSASSGAVASSSDALAELLSGVQLSNNTVNPPPPPPLATTPQSNARSSRFAFANQPSGLSIPATSPGAPSPHHASSSVPSSPFGMLESSSRRGAPPSPFGYGAAVSGLNSSSSGPGAFPLHSDTSAFPPLGSHALPPQQQHHAPPPFSSSGFGAGAPSAPPSSGASDDLMMMGSGLAFLQQMLPNVNISFGGDYPASSAGFPDLSHSASGATGPGSAWHSSNGSLSSLGFDDATRSSSSGAPGFYDPAIVSHSSGLQSASFFSGLSGGASSESESDRAHHLHSALSGAGYRHPGSILNNGN